MKEKFMKLRKIILAVISIYAIAFYFEYDDKLYAKVLRFANNMQGLTNRIDLDLYKVNIEAKTIQNVKDNLSGITYNPNTNTLFAITNRPREIHELSLEGELLRTIVLKGFKDTEGITFVKDNTLTIVDERKAGFYLLDVNKSTSEIDIKDIQKKFQLKINSFENFGYEGIAYNSLEDEFYLVNEKFSKELITVSNWLENKSSMKVSMESNENSVTSSLRDLSGMHYSNKYKNLLVLSHESRLLVEVDKDGEKLSFMDLESGFMGLKNNIPQAEGVTMDNEDNIYIVSEPNLFYKFKKQNI